MQASNEVRTKAAVSVVEMAIDATAGQHGGHGGPRWARAGWLPGRSVLVGVTAFAAPNSPRPPKPRPRHSCGNVGRNGQPWPAPDTRSAPRGLAGPRRLIIYCPHY